MMANNIIDAIDDYKQHHGRVWRPVWRRTNKASYIYYCKLKDCTYVTVRPFNMSRHINKSHSGSCRILRCCHRIYYNKSDHIWHVIQSHQRITRPPKPTSNEMVRRGLVELFDLMKSIKTAVPRKTPPQPRFQRPRSRPYILSVPPCEMRLKSDEKKTWSLEYHYEQVQEQCMLVQIWQSKEFEIWGFSCPKPSTCTMISSYTSRPYNAEPLKPVCTKSTILVDSIRHHWNLCLDLDAQTSYPMEVPGCRSFVNNNSLSHPTAVASSKYDKSLNLYALQVAIEDLTVSHKPKNKPSPQINDQPSRIAHKQELNIAPSPHRKEQSAFQIRKSVNSEKRYTSSQIDFPPLQTPQNKNKQDDKNGKKQKKQAQPPSQILKPSKWTAYYGLRSAELTQVKAKLTDNDDTKATSPLENQICQTWVGHPFSFQLQNHLNFEDERKVGNNICSKVLEMPKVTSERYDLRLPTERLESFTKLTKS